MSTGATVSASIPAKWRFDYLPVSLFGSVMGLTGLSIAWRLAQAGFGAPQWAAAGVDVAAVAAFILILLGYTLKAMMAPDAVRAEFAWLMISRWMSDRQLIAQVAPAWIVPVVGLLDVPLALPSLEPHGGRPEPGAGLRHHHLRQRSPRSPLASCLTASGRRAMAAGSMSGSTL